MIDLLCPEGEPDVGRHRLGVALSALRQRLEAQDVPAGSVIVADRASVRLNPETITTDVVEFEAALHEAARAGSPAERADALDPAVAWYRGERLPGVSEDWVLQEREGLAGGRQAPRPARCRPQTGSPPTRRDPLTRTPPVTAANPCATPSPFHDLRAVSAASGNQMS